MKLKFTFLKYVSNFTILYIFINICILSGCKFNSDNKTMNNQEIWKLKWRMVISSVTENYNLGVKQFDSLLIYEKNIEDKFLIAGLDLLARNNDTLRIKQILDKQSKKTLQALCREELFVFELPSYIDCESLSEKIENPALQRRLMKMFVQDQLFRGGNQDFIMKKYNINRDSITRGIDNIQDLDENNTYNLIKIIDRYGFPTKEMVGRDGMEAVFFIIQHSPDKEFQSNQLNNIQNSVDNGGLDPQHYALLFDRIAIRNGKKQKYGTQLDGNLNLKPVDDYEMLDSLRMSMGLMPINMYVSFLKGKYNK